MSIVTNTVRSLYRSSWTNNVLIFVIGTSTEAHVRIIISDILRGTQKTGVKSLFTPDEVSHASRVLVRSRSSSGALLLVNLVCWSPGVGSGLRLPGNPPGTELELFFGFPS